MAYSREVKKSLSSITADELRHDILIKDLKEGELLNELALAEKFGISRGPIREAISILVNEGILESLPNGRTKVIGFRSAEMQDYYNLRLYIESEAIKKILAMPDDDNFRAWLLGLTDLIELSKKSLNNYLNDRYYEIDIEFHMSIVGYENSQISKQVWKMLSNFNRSIMTLNKLYLKDKHITDSKAAIKSHERIVEYLSNRDEESVLNELSWHMQESVQVYKKILSDVSKLNS